MYPKTKAKPTPIREPTNCAINETPPSPPNISSPKIPAATPPHRPHNPCRGQTPSTSSIFHLFCVMLKVTTNNAPATPPVISAPIGWNKSEPAQTATRPAKGPLYKNPGSFFPTNNAAKVPPTIAISELTATSPDTPDNSCADITLNPNHPTVRIHDPSAKKGMLDGGKATNEPSFLYLPYLEPKIKTAASANQPPKP